MIRTFCDRCGAEITEKAQGYVDGHPLGLIVGVSDATNKVITEHAELCEDCYKRFKDFLRLGR